MRRYLKSLSLFSLLALTVVGLTLCGTIISPKADLVINNAKIYTMDTENPSAEALACVGEKIIAVGNNQDIERYIKGGHTHVINARGRVVLPGFNDAHIHFTSGGQSLMELPLRGITDPQKIQNMVKSQVAKVPSGVVIRGGGFDHETFPERQWPTKALLDRVAPRNPVILSRMDGHSVWVNSYVLKASNINKNTPDPPGGHIIRDSITGEPTGILQETAINLIDIDEEYSQEKRYRLKRKAWLKAMRRANQAGLTSVQHLNGDYDLIQELKEEDLLTLRVTFNMWLEDDITKLQLYDSLRQQYPREDNWIRFGYLKEFVDGSLGSGTALRFTPYQDNPATSGLAQMSYKELEERVLTADSMGFQIGVHAIGKKANYWLLNAYQEARGMNGCRDSRHRSEHAQHLTADDMQRFKTLGVVASMQPTHCITDMVFAEKRLGKTGCQGAYAWNSLLKSGARIAFGSDWPVAELDPLLGIYAAVTRQDTSGQPVDGWFPEERISVGKAVELYTRGSAYAEFMEGRKGELKAGMLADMVLLSQNIFDIPPHKILHSKVDYTIVGGKVVYTRN